MNKIEELKNNLVDLEKKLEQINVTKDSIEKEISKTKKAIEKQNKELKPYDLVYILKPNSTAKEISSIENIIKNIATDNNKIEENIKQCEHIGLKKLAYEVHSNKEGYYVSLRLKMTDNDLILVERELRKAEFVLKFITLRITEENWEEDL